MHKAVSIIVRSEDSIWISRRQGKGLNNFDSLLQVAGGTVEPLDSSNAVAAARELGEEMGRNLRDAALQAGLAQRHVQQFVKPNGQPYETTTYLTVVPYYIAKPVDQEPWAAGPWQLIPLNDVVTKYTSSDFVPGLHSQLRSIHREMLIAHSLAGPWVERT